MLRSSFPLIAATVAPAAHAILLVDQAGWHLSTRLLVPANITIILLPPKCPELNPVENFSQFMRDDWLSNRIFKSYDDRVDHCCAAWNKLVDQPWRIMYKRTCAAGSRRWPAARLTHSAQPKKSLNSAAVCSGISSGKK